MSKELKDMNVTELKAHAKEKEIVIPKELTKKDELIPFIEGKSLEGAEETAEAFEDEPKAEVKEDSKYIEVEKTANGVYVWDKELKKTVLKK